jgi:UMF1 family MFS transporter
MPFYNSLLYSIADGSPARLISGIGVAFGYIGAVFGLILVQPFVTGSLFGWDVPLISGGGKTGSFIPTGVIFLLFALPLFFWVRETSIRKPGRMGLKKAYIDVWNGLRDTRKFPGVRRFLIADYFIEDAVATVIINIGLYCSIVLGIGDQQIDMFLIISTISAILGSFLIGKINQLWSLKKMLTIIVWGWILALLISVSAVNQTMVWVLGSLVGILLGGLWTTTRPLLGELVPKEDLGRFFGLFSLSGRAAAVIGPLVWTIVVYLFHPNRTLGASLISLVGMESVDLEKLPYKMAILALAGLMAIGLIILRKVPHTRGHIHGT